MIEEVRDELSAPVISNLAPMQPQHSEGGRGLHCLGEGVAVCLGELKQTPLKVHATALHTDTQGGDTLYMYMFIIIIHVNVL